MIVAKTAFSAAPASFDATGHMPPSCGILGASRAGLHVDDAAGTIRCARPASKSRPPVGPGCLGRFAASARAGADRRSGMTDETTSPNADDEHREPGEITNPEDLPKQIDVESDGDVTRIDIADDAETRPGEPGPRAEG
jgi:hypothetical protein